MIRSSFGIASEVLLRVLIVVAHPLDDSFAKAALSRVRAVLERRKDEVDVIDLYRDGFDPRLTSAERRGYFAQPYQPGADVTGYVERLRAAEKLVLIFPQWWFAMPAIMKGFFDRVFAPGVAFEHDRAGGRLIPKLDHIRALWVVSSTGSPWWVARLWMGDPVRKLLKRGIMSFVARGASFRMMTLHDMDRMTDDKAKAFLARLEAAFARF